MTPTKEKPRPSVADGTGAIDNQHDPDNRIDAPEQLYRSRYGHIHTVAAFQNWHPQVIAFMDLQLIGSST